MATAVVERPLPRMPEGSGYHAPDRAACMALGKKPRAAEAATEPFPPGACGHVLPLEVHDRAVAKAPRGESGRFKGATSRLKLGDQPGKVQSSCSEGPIHALNSQAFPDVLTCLTGIPKGIGDPNEVGGGLDAARCGGHLPTRTGFSLHPDLQLRRRLNLILFLSRNRGACCGGALELWARGLSTGGALDPGPKIRTRDVRVPSGTKDKPSPGGQACDLPADVNPPFPWRPVAT